jgi:hypothetical protein
MNLRLRITTLALTALLVPGLPSSRTGAAPVPNLCNLAAIEFVDSPPTGLVVSGGLLGVPDSAGVFPVPYRRFDPNTTQGADPGRTAGDALVFANLRPGTYRLAMVFLHESRLASKVLPKHGERLEDHCLVYADSLAPLTFTIRDGEFYYLGRLVRRMLPSLSDQQDLWKTTLEWSKGDERKVVKSLSKRKDMASWRDLLTARLATLDSSLTMGR